MTTIQIVNGQDQISNGAGIQVTGNHGPNLADGLSPRELLEGALGLCISISLQKVLERDGIEYDKSAIRVEVTAVKENEKENRFSRFDVLVTFPPTLEPAYKHKLETVIERACTIGNTLKGEVTIELKEA